jgi:hypothetical protein
LMGSGASTATATGAPGQNHAPSKEPGAPVAVLCVTVLSCQDLSPPHDSGDHNNGNNGRYVLVEAAGSGQAAALADGPAPILKGGEGEHLVFRVYGSQQQHLSRVRLLLMMGQRIAKAAAAASGLAGLVGVAEIQLRNAHMGERWKLDQEVTFITPQGQTAGSCRVVLRWDPDPTVRARSQNRALREDMLAIYRAHNERKIGDVDALLVQWKGQEDVLHAKMMGKYGVYFSLDGCQCPAHTHMDTRAQLAALYANHDPHPHEKIAQLDRLLLEWKGNELGLLGSVRAHYERRASVEVVRAELVAIYTKRNRRKLTDVDELLLEWEGDEEELLKLVLEKYPDKAIDNERRARQLRGWRSHAKLAAHVGSSALFGEFGEPPSLQHSAEEQAAEARRTDMVALVAALTEAGTQRSAAQHATVLSWCATVEYFRSNIKSKVLMAECAQALTLVRLEAGQELYREGTPGQCFDAILSGAIGVLEGTTEVAVLHPPATLVSTVTVRSQRSETGAGRSGRMMRGAGRGRWLCLLA